MNKKDVVIDSIFLIALAFTVIVLLADIYVGRTNAEAACEPTATPTAEETIEDITVIETTEATEPVDLYDVPLEADLQLYIIDQAEAHGIEPAIVIAMAFKESSYRADAIGDGGNSLGLLQVQPRWHSERMEKLGCPNLLDPYQNVTVAVDYLCELLSRYGSIDKALTAYNRGNYSGTVTQYAKTVLAKAEGLELM